MPEQPKPDTQPTDRTDNHQRGGDDPEIQKEPGDLELDPPSSPAHTAPADPDLADVAKPADHLEL